MSLFTRRYKKGYTWNKLVATMMIYTNIANPSVSFSNHCTIYWELNETPIQFLLMTI